MFLLLLTLSGCNSASSKRRYENTDFGISLEKPTSWNIQYNERNRSIVLDAEIGIWSEASVLMVIKGTAISPLPYNSELELETSITRINALYGLESAIVIHKPMRIESEEYEIGIATISIPTMSIPEASTGNQVGFQSSDVFQTIEMRALKCPSNFAMIYLYKGNSEKLNAEANAIINSIELICSPKSLAN